MKHIRTLALLAAFAAAPAVVSAQDTLEISPELMEAIQTDVATIHVALMQDNIVLQPGQAGTFWAVYDEYLAEVRELTAERAELIKDFAMAFDTMTDESATTMGRRAIEFDARRNALVSKYFERIASEIGGIVAGQFLQIENRIQTIKDLQVELEVPIIG